MTQSITALARKLAMLTVSIGAASLLPACGMSSLTSGLGSSVFSGGSSTSTTTTGAVNEEQLLTAAKDGDLPGVAGTEVSAGCPKFVPWPRDNFITVYEQNRVGDSLSIMHRGEITKTARECIVEGSRVMVKYGFSGRVLLGPRGKPGPISLPVSVFVTDSKRERVANDKLKVDVNVAVENPIGYFSAVRMVTFEVPEGSRAGEYQVFVGFDKTVPGAG